MFIKMHVLHSMLLWPMIFHFFCSWVSAQTIGMEFEKTDVSSGILFIPTNMVQLSYNKWHLCYYFDMSLYYEETEKIRECVNELQFLCNDEVMANNYADSQLCQAVVKLFNEHLSAMAVNDEIINSFRSRTVRSKRAPLEFVGQVLSAVFGVLDTKDASKYNSDIERLKSDDKYQFELLRQQTTIVESTIRANEYSIGEVKEKVSDLTRNLEAMKAYWFKENNHLHLKTHFNMLASVANLILLHHSNTAETVINLLSNSIHGKMTNLVPISRLKSQLSEIEKTLEKNQELPMDINEENVYQLFSISEINSLLIDNRIMLEINFPILNRDVFTLYEAISVPAPSGEKFARIAPASYHFLTDRELTKFIPVGQEERERCWQRNKHANIICSVNAPVQTNLRENCELQLLRNPQITELPRDCIVEEMPKRDYVIPLPQTNTYFLRLVSNMTVRIVCGNNFSNAVLTESGLIHIRPDCVVSNEFFTLMPHAVFKTVDDRTIVPTLRIGDISIENLRIRNGRENRPALIEHTKYVFDQLANDVALAREREDLTSQVTRVHDELEDTRRYYWILPMAVWFGGVLPLMILICIGRHKILKYAGGTGTSVRTTTPLRTDVADIIIETDSGEANTTNTRSNGWLEIH